MVYRLNDKYSGWLEAVSPYSTTYKRITIGAEGDEVEILSRWVDMTQDCTWYYIELKGEEGWVLAHEVDEILELL